MEEPRLIVLTVALVECGRPPNPLNDLRTYLLEEDNNFANRFWFEEKKRRWLLNKIKRKTEYVLQITKQYV